MNYRLTGGVPAFVKLAEILNEACRQNGVTLGTLKSVNILKAVLSKAETAGILTQMAEGTPPGGKKS